MEPDVESNSVSTNAVPADVSEGKSISEAQQQLDLPNDALATTQIRQPLSGPEQSLPASAVPDTQSEQIQVKTEMGDVPMPDLQVPGGGPVQGGDTQTVSNLPISPAVLQQN